MPFSRTVIVAASMRLPPSLLQSYSKLTPTKRPISTLNFPYRHYRRVCLSRACLGKMIVFIQLCINRSKEAFVRYSHRIRMETDPPTSGTVNGTARHDATRDISRQRTAGGNQQRRD